MPQICKSSPIFAYECLETPIHTRKYATCKFLQNVIYAVVYGLQHKFIKTRMQTKLSNNDLIGHNSCWLHTSVVDRIIQCNFGKLDKPARVFDSRQSFLGKKCGSHVIVPKLTQLLNIGTSQENKQVQ